jgi:nucleoside-diphosphate-sugar epimerase
LLVNSIGTRNLLELAKRASARFLLASTSEVYGDPLHHPQEETYWGRVNPIGPRSCYDESKRFAESLTMTYRREFGLDIRIARIFNTYGPRARPDDGRLVPNFCMQALSGLPLTIYGEGTQSRSLCYVDDLVRGLLALMEAENCAGEVVNLGNPDERTVADVARQIIAASGSRSPLVHCPLPIDEPVRRRPDISKARRLLGWEPHVDLDTGLARTLEYFRPLAETRQ